MAAPKGNQYAVGANSGKPPIYSSEEELIAAVDSYFTYIQGESHTETKTKKNAETGELEAYDCVVWDRYPEPATVTGLALFLGFASRQSLFDYQKKEEYSYIIKKARTIVEHEYEKALHGDKPTGAIFALKNMNWSDKLQIESTVSQKPAWLTEEITNEPENGG